MKFIWLLVVGLSVSAFAQVAPPKHWHKDDDGLEQHYRDLRCSLLLIRTGEGYGTGFFVSADGDVATASHVLGPRSYTSLPDKKMKVDLSPPASFEITDYEGKVHTIAGTQVESNRDAWGADVALIKTGIQTKCWLLPADDKSTVPGEHLITMGFPGLAFGSVALYSGIMSARLKPDILVGVTNTGEAVQQKNEFIRVQMPISPGLSGSPLVNDRNEVVGVVTAAGFSTQKLDMLILANRQHAFDALNPPPANPPPPGQAQVTFNVFQIVAELAESLREFGSPGYGDAVPITYLRKAQPTNH
ncbi:MAG TPA: serine protease [Verrucomicrobiae bacterium]|nr:serine protease [Verrucomicrobiae bacterium]